MGRVVFAATLLLIVGTLNIIYGIGVLDGANIFVNDTFGRVIGIIGGSLGAIGALLSIGGSYPWWSLGIFALCVYVVHGIIVYGNEERVPAT